MKYQPINIVRGVNTVSLLVRLRVEMNFSQRVTYAPVVSLLVRLRVEIDCIKNDICSALVSLLVRLRVEIAINDLVFLISSSQPPREAAS